MEGMSVCTACNSGEITPALGATGAAMCVNPTPNFTIGLITLFVVFVMIYIYLLQGRLQSIAFERRVLFVQPLAKVCHKINRRLLKEMYRRKPGKHNMSSHFRVLIFLISSVLFVFFFIIAYYMLIFYKAFYKAMFLWKGFSGFVTVPPFISTIEKAVVDVAKWVHLPVGILQYLFYPIAVLFRLTSMLSLNMSTISVKCNGAKAPTELLINFFIVGIVVSFMLSGYQYLWIIVFPSLNQTFLNFNFLKGNIIRNRNAYLCFLGVAAMSINPFEGIMRFLMNVLTLTDFVATNGAHAITPACDNISGLEKFDSLLGYSSSVVAWWLVMPFIYIMSEVLVPKTILRKNETLLDDLPIMVVDHSNPNVVVPLQGVGVGRRRQSALHFELAMIQKAREKSESKALLHRYQKFASKIVSTLISVDIIIITTASQWLQILSHLHGIKDVATFDRDSDSDESESDENSLSSEDEDVESDSSARNRQPLQRRNAEIHKTTQSGLVGFKKKHKTKRWLDWEKIRSRMLLEQHKKQFERDQSKLIKAKEEELRGTADRLSTYNQLCVLVGKELQRQRVPKTAAVLLGWLGPGHAFTVVGRRHWNMVGRKYYIFLMACLGVWTDETVASYGLEEIARTIFIDEDNEVNYSRLLYLSVGSRAILFQIMKVLTFFSVTVGAVAGTPLFVYSETLEDNLADLVVTDSWQRAVEKEQTVSGNYFVDDTHWIVGLRAISIAVGDSRLLSFISNMLGVCLSLIILIYSKKTQPVVLLILTLMFPFALAQTMMIIVFIGKSLDLKDSHFVRFFKLLANLLTCGYSRYHIEPEVLRGDDLDLEAGEKNSDEWSESIYLSSESSELESISSESTVSLLHKDRRRWSNSDSERSEYDDSDNTVESEDYFSFSDVDQEEVKDDDSSVNEETLAGKSRHYYHYAVVASKSQGIDSGDVDSNNDDDHDNDDMTSGDFDLSTNVESSVLSSSQRNEPNDAEVNNSLKPFCDTDLVDVATVVAVEPVLPILDETRPLDLESAQNTVVSYDWFEHDSPVDVDVHVTTEVVFVDEQGNVIDASDANSDDYEVIEEHADDEELLIEQAIKAHFSRSRARDQQQIPETETPFSDHQQELTEASAPPPSVLRESDYAWCLQQPAAAVNEIPHVLANDQSENATVVTAVELCSNKVDVEASSESGSESGDVVSQSCEELSSNEVLVYEEVDLIVVDEDGNIVDENDMNSDYETVCEEIVQEEVAFRPFESLHVVDY
jgi:hypothetical protein